MSQSSRWDTQSHPGPGEYAGTIPGAAQRLDVSPQGELPGSGARTRELQDGCYLLPWNHLQGREGPRLRWVPSCPQEVRTE